MSAWLAAKGLSIGWRIALYAAVCAALAGALWWAVGAPRVALASARADLATLQATHDALVTRLAEAEAASADKAEAVRTAYDAGVKSADEMRELETTNAYNRGVDTGRRIAAGTQRVRVEWRDHCPATAEGPGAGSGEGAAEVSGGRAEAIGTVLGAGGGWDAQYAEAMRRLEAAQAVVDACYEKPAR